MAAERDSAQPSGSSRTAHFTDAVGTAMGAQTRPAVPGGRPIKLGTPADPDPNAAASSPWRGSRDEDE